jgi:hypothetical protein
MKIDVIDMTDPNLGNDRANRVQNYSDGIIKMYPMSNGIVQMTIDVVNAVAQSQGLDVLRIWGHGWSGGQLLAAGADAQSGVDNASALSSYNINDYAWCLQNLCPLFSAAGHLELKGCQVAKSDAGELFLVKLAVILAVPVQASQAVQGGAGSNLTTPGMGWDGTVVQATPDLVVAYIPGSSL